MTETSLFVCILYVIIVLVLHGFICMCYMCVFIFCVYTKHDVLYVRDLKSTTGSDRSFLFASPLAKFYARGGELWNTFKFTKPTIQYHMHSKYTIQDTKHKGRDLEYI